MTEPGHPHAAHWGSFLASARPDGGIDVLPSRDRSRSVADSRQPRVGRAAPEPHRPPGDPSALARARPRAGRAPGRRRIRRGRMADGLAPDGSRAAAGLRPRGGPRVRRLVRLGECRAVPPRAEPDPPVPEPARWLRPLREQLQRGRRRGDPAPRHRAQGRRRPLRHALAGRRRAGRPRRRVRRHAAQERRRSTRAARAATRFPAVSPARGSAACGSSCSARSATTCPTAWTATGIRSARVRTPP